VHSHEEKREKTEVAGCTGTPKKGVRQEGNPEARRQTQEVYRDSAIMPGRRLLSAAQEAWQKKRKER